MLLKRSAQYTLQALIYLARQPAGRTVMIREIAETLNLPVHYLAKLMQGLSREGWLVTSRGRAGGVYLDEAARARTFLEIMDSIQVFRSDGECLLGLKACEDDSACVLHCRWRPIKQELWHYLGSYSLAQLAASDYADLQGLANGLSGRAAGNAPAG